jgi:hypothetical protein
LRKLLFRAEREFREGERYLKHAERTFKEADKNEGHGDGKFTSHGAKARYESLSQYAKATRAFTRAQVRAQQVNNALVPPPDSFEDLGL